MIEIFFDWCVLVLEIIGEYPSKIKAEFEKAGIQLLPILLRSDITGE